MNDKKEQIATLCLIISWLIIGIIIGIFFGTRQFVPCQRADIITGETTIFLVIGSDIGPKNRTKLIEWCKGN